MPSEEKVIKPKAGRTEVRVDEFIAGAVPDPKNPGEALFVSGFIGAATEPENTRIYWDASLSTYVDVRTSDIVHSEPLSKEQSPLGGACIWLKREAQVSFGAGAQTAKGKFLEGPLVAAYGQQFGAAAGGAVGAPDAPAIVQSFALCSLLCGPSAFFGCTRSPFACTRYCSVVCYVVPTYAGCGFAPVGQAAGPEVAGAAAIGTLACPPHASYPFYCPHRPPNPQLAVAGAAVVPTLACPPTYWACPNPSYPFYCPHRPPNPQLGVTPQINIPSVVCSYAPYCWFSGNACPTFFGCGPQQTLGCPQI
jgi:hypothetical protein